MCLGGFLPSRRTARIKRLKFLATEARTLVFYEAPHRICAMVADVQTVFGNDRLLCLAKEISKAHERLLVAPPADVIAWLNEYDSRQKGEFTLVLENRHNDKPVSSPLHINENDLFEALLDCLPARKAATLTARLSGGSANRLYRHALEKK